MPIAIEVENTKTAIKYGALAVATTAVVGKLAYMYYKSKQTNETNQSTTNQEQSGSRSKK